jgi:hypothetical protein
MVAGLVLVGVGAIGLTGGDAQPIQATATTTSLTAATTTTRVATSTTMATTTTTAATTTTVAPQTVQDFVFQLRAAIDVDDIEWVFARLHPAVVGAYGADVCRSWVGSEIIKLENYGLIGEVTGPSDKTAQLPGGDQVIKDMFDAPIRFSFEGQSFDSVGSFALVDGLMYWLGKCE